MSDRRNASEPRLERRRIRVRGVVQGVGFRPFVFRLAQEMGLSGWVRNDGEGVEIEAQGPRGDLSALMARLVGEAPPLARVDSVMSSLDDPVPEDRGFAIEANGSGQVSTAIGHDTAVCADCLAEMFDPGDRRWRYPFINCTHCGPRYTITRALPYDRALTSMAGFVQCRSCQQEYDAVADRRFHAEPNACPTCGPSLALLESSGVRVATRDPVADVLLHLARHAPVSFEVHAVTVDPGTDGFQPEPLVPYVTVGAFFFAIMMISGAATFLIMPAMLSYFPAHAISGRPKGHGGQVHGVKDASPALGR